MNFQHFLLTNFNIRKQEWNKDANSLIVRTDAWMDHRIKLFEKYCFPSIQNQTQKNFLWLVFFDESTSQKYRELIDSYVKSCANLVPIFISDGKKETQLKELYKKVSTQTEYLITTRIDNDDALSCDAMETIQRNFNYQHFIFVNLLKGYIIREKISCAEEERSNPFITLIEKRSSQSETPFKTVWFDQHLALEKYGTITQIQDKPYWLRVIHERNLNNVLKGRQCPLDEVRKHFPYIDK